MKFIDAMAVVRDLANENVLDPGQAAGGLEEERSFQLEAVEQMDAFLSLLQGHHL